MDAKAHDNKSGAMPLLSNNLHRQAHLDLTGTDRL